MSMGRRALLASLVASASPALASNPEGYVVEGYASWYGDWHHGKKTASGRVFDMWSDCAAHRTLPLGTRVVILNLANGRTETATIWDRGPYVRGRILDVSRGLARKLGGEARGVFPVRVTVLSWPTKDPTTRAGGRR